LLTERVATSGETEKGENCGNFCDVTHDKCSLEALLHSDNAITGEKDVEFQRIRRFSRELAKTGSQDAASPGKNPGGQFGDGPVRPEGEG
jgi:hypothetical protein